MSSRGPRIVSLLPSATEIVYALGLGENLVGRSHECDYPTGVETLPACCDSRVSLSLDSGELDTQVKSLVKDGLSIYEVFHDRLKRLAPDVIITQTQCEVCAVSEAEVEQAVQDWIGGQPTIISLAPQDLAQVWQSIDVVAQALDVATRASELQSTIQGRIDTIVEKTHGSPPRSIACLEWLDPVMAAGNWVPELVSLAGAVDLFGKPGEHSPWLAWDELERADPDIILALPCGFSLERTRQESVVLSQHDTWARMRAVGEHQAFFADGHQFFNRPGPRLVESLEILAEIIHPTVFPALQQGTGWERLQ